MFGKRKSSQSRQDPSSGVRQGAGSAPNGSASQDTLVKRPSARPTPAAGTGQLGSQAPVREAARRPAPPIPQAAPRAASQAAAASRTENRPNGSTDDDVDASRKLVVGKGISLSGQIKTCEKLVVEGKVEANLTDCVTLEIAESGLFNGSAKVQDAEISGCFEGDLVVFGRLYLRSNGILEGTIKYADLEIERGGKIAGTVDLIDDPVAAAAEIMIDEEEDADDSEDDAAAETSSETSADTPGDPPVEAVAVGRLDDAATQESRQGQLKIS